jgi:hypothetical protein
MEFFEQMELYNKREEELEVQRAEEKRIQQ